MRFSAWSSPGHFSLKRSIQRLRDYPELVDVDDAQIGDA